MNKYEIELHLAKLNTELKLDKKKDVIYQAQEAYNQRSAVMQNPKTVRIQDVTENYVRLTLESELVLYSVGRALRSFSVILLKEFNDEDFNAEVTKSGALFRAVLLDDACETEQNGKKELTDLELLKGLMDYVCGKRDPDSTAYRRKRSAMEQIKKICLESGIIS